MGVPMRAPSPRLNTQDASQCSIGAGNETLDSFSVRRWRIRYVLGSI